MTKPGAVARGSCGRTVTGTSVGSDSTPLFGRCRLDAARRRDEALGGDDADAVAADRIEHRLDVNEPQAERPVCDEECFGSGYPLDADFRRHPAPRERPRTARPIRRDGEDAGRPPLQRLIGAIEQVPRAGRIGSGGVEQGRLSRHRRGDVIERRREGVDLRAHRSLDARQRLGLIVGSKARALDGDADAGCQRRAHQAGQVDAAERARNRRRAHGAELGASVGGASGAAGGGVSAGLAASGAGAEAGAAPGAGLPTART